MTDLTLDEQVEDLFPVDGPHGEDRSREAARSIAALVRYLNHATYHAEATPYPSVIDAVVRSLGSAVFGLDQLLRQLGDQFDAQVERFGDRLYSDDGRPAGAVADAFRANLDAARYQLTEAAGNLQRAGSYGNHLGVRSTQAAREGR